MNQLLSVIKSTLKAKIVPLWSKLTYYTNVNFIQSKVVSKIREKLTSLFSIKPRHKDDYFTVGRLLVSRRLVQAIVVVIGVLSLVYIIYQINVNQVNNDGTFGKVYWYNSIPLRFTDAEVAIKAKDGYIAYRGHVKDGVALGEGKLYDAEEKLVYSGAFADNMYNGSGILYYNSGEIHYKGDFANNLFEGKGNLYRKSGSLEYEGDFVGGQKEGQGILYNVSETPIYTGTFHSDDIVYTQFLGKTTQDIAKVYTGDQILYNRDDEWVIVMDEINAVYVARSNEDSIEDALEVDQVYVLTNEFRYGQDVALTIKDVTELLGEPTFKGNSYITLPEAVIAKHMEIGALDADLLTLHPSKEVYDVTSYDKTSLVYLYIYTVDDTTYTFVTDKADSEFFFYSIQQ